MALEAATDPLTGLPNRRAWEHRLASISSSSPGSAHPYCLAIFDLDHFKRINDTLGLDAGDELLRGVAKILRHGLRQCDFLARLGGDEFAILFAGLAPHDAPSVVERIRQALPLRLPAAQQPAITSSVGYATPTDPNPVAAFRAAASALRAAKQAGRDRSQGPNLLE